MKAVLYFVFGGMVGSVITYCYLNKKHKKEIDDLYSTLDDLKHLKIEKNDDENNNIDSVSETEEALDETEFNDDGSIKDTTFDDIQKNGYHIVSSKESKEYKIIAERYATINTDGSSEPYVITEDEFCEHNGYDKKYVMFNEDTHEAWEGSTGELIDANAELGDYLGLMDVDNSSDDGYIYIRSDRHSTDYAVDLTFTPGADHSGN